MFIPKSASGLLENAGSGRKAFVLPDPAGMRTYPEESYSVRPLHGTLPPQHSGRYGRSAMHGWQFREHRHNLVLEYMHPNASPYASMTDADSWRDDVHAAMVSCYTHRAINHLAASEMEVSAKMNNNAEFWHVTSYSLQNTLFILLSRILDPDSALHSVHKVLNATVAHPEFFSKAARQARKLSVPGRGLHPKILDEEDQDPWEPTAQDLRALKKELRPYKGKFDEIYRPIRNQIAHIILKDDEQIADLYSKTQKTEIDAILCFLHGLVKAIRYMAYNGQPRDVKRDNYGYADKVARISKDTESMLRGLP